MFSILPGQTARFITVCNHGLPGRNPLQINLYAEQFDSGAGHEHVARFRIPAYMQPAAGQNHLGLASGPARARAGNKGRAGAGAA